MDNPEVKIVVRSFAIEVFVYAALVIVYFLLVLRWLAEPLNQLFHNNLVVYAFASLGLIVVQGVILDFVVLGRPQGTEVVFDEAALQAFAALLEMNTGAEVRIL